MKKIILLMCFAPFIGFSQVKMPSNALNAPMVSNANLNEKEVWLDILGQMKQIKFEQTPVGAKHLFEGLEELLRLNNLSKKPTKDDSLYASYAKDIKDYQSINLSIVAGDGEIIMSWLVEPRNIIMVKMTKKEYTIMVQ